MPELDPDSEAERRLLHAIEDGELCDFADGASINQAQMNRWGPERTVRARFVRQLLITNMKSETESSFRLRGAHISGVLHLSNCEVPELALDDCLIEHAQFTEATFKGTAGFDGVTFGNAEFGRTRFTGNASFDLATFTKSANFDRAIFTGNADFVVATFKGTAQSGGATFTRNTSFDLATFTKNVSFDLATFTGNAWFGEATFTRTAQFNKAIFTGEARFGGALAQRYVLNGAKFQGNVAGPWIAEEVSLVGTVMQTRARVAIIAFRADLSRLQVREGVHLVTQIGSLDLSDAEFLRPSILAHADANEQEFAGQREEPQQPDGLAEKPDGVQERYQARLLAHEFAVELLTKLKNGIQRTAVQSMARATVTDLSLSGLRLDNCEFAGAHGLDRLRIDASCSFVETHFPHTRRRMLREEIIWRQKNLRTRKVLDRIHGPHLAEQNDDANTPPPAVEPNVLPPLEIAGLYRVLRKGLEDAKDEPGAADFYYGEMDMRRLAAHRTRTTRLKHLHRLLDLFRLLDLYRAFSGYGLRASRALLALTAVLLISAALFTQPTFAHIPDAPQAVCAVNPTTGIVRYGASTAAGAAQTCPTQAIPTAKVRVAPRHNASPGAFLALEFTAREALTVTRTTGTPLVTTTAGPGSLVDILLRLLAPLFLGLALLAVRGRTKR